jgi:hypothetical protein
MPSFNIDIAVQYAQAKAKPHTERKCAEYTRKAIQAGLSGAVMRITHDARNYGLILEEVGFKKVGLPSYVRYDYKRGDVVVIQRIRQGHEGHMAIFDGFRWISDFKQRIGTDVYPGGAYRAARPSFQLYRYPEKPEEAVAEESASGQGFKAGHYARPGFRPVIGK